ncbi:MAG: hypothetical protein DMF93_02125 [Acidobacteria bacterium]|nr:MAG: hypothetical protein DMF93_02125 [Acidobacteriota bacterium]
MSWELRVDPERRVSHVRMRDTVTFDELEQVQRVLGRDAAFDPSFSLLIDLRAARDVELTWAELDAIIARDPVDACARRAVVVGNLIMSAIARVYQFMRQDMTRAPAVRICQSLDEAWQWLRIRPIDS